MKSTQSQTRAQELRAQYEAQIAETHAHIDELIESYCIIKKLRPAFARDWLSSIEHAIDWLRYQEEQLAHVDDYADLPF